MAAALSSAVSASPRSQRRAHTLPLRSNSACCCSCLDAGKSRFPSQKCRLPMRRPRILRRPGSVFSRGLSEAPPRTTNYEFSDGVAEVELRLDLVATNVQSSRDIVVDVDESSLRVRTQNSGSLVIIFETSHLYEKIKPSETIWFIDEEQLVIILKKYDTNLQWPDIMETWESLTRGLVQLLKGTSIYIVGESTEINEKVAGALAAGLGYTPFSTGELLETYAQQSLDAWLIAEGEDSVAEAERSVIESLSRHVRAVVATLGGQHGNARRADKWRHLYAGFTIWLSQTEAVDDASAKEEARKHIEYGCVGYSNADVVVKFEGWESDGAQTIAQACLSALKRLIISDKELTGKKSLYIRLGCRGDWPNIKPPGWDPSTGEDVRMGI